MLKYFFSDTLAFTDSTNMARSDIKGAPRSFPNISAMAEEISISRFYGGIHFSNTLKVSLAYGKKIGINTADPAFFKAGLMSIEKDIAKLESLTRKKA